MIKERLPFPQLIADIAEVRRTHASNKKLMAILDELECHLAISVAPNPPLPARRRRPKRDASAAFLRQRAIDKASIIA